MSMEWRHGWAEVNGLTMHYVEQGQGPLLILAHGFPHTWFSWHRQIPALAAAGWRVVAPDLRGMGDTSAPADPALYDVPHTVGDLTGLLDHLGEERAVFAGLDFGLFSIYDLAYTQPGKVAAIIGLNNPAWPHDPARSPLTEAAQMGQRHFYHIDYFTARPGVGPRPRWTQSRVNSSNASFTRSQPIIIISMFGTIRRERPILPHCPQRRLCPGRGSQSWSWNFWSRPMRNRASKAG